MDKAIVTKTFKSDKSKDGKEFKDKNGKKFWKVAIQTDRTNSDWYSCLAFREDDRVMFLKEGDEHLFIFEEKGGYKNFRMPTKLDVLESRVEALERFIKNKATDEVKGYEQPKEEIDPSEIPF